jgi:hypothetical protein
MDFPLLESHMKDERTEGVYLLTEGDGEKTTADVCDTWWRIRYWQIMDLQVKQYWGCVYECYVEKRHLPLLTELQRQLDKAEKVAE